MLHLAQIQKKGYLGKAGLRLLAAQKSEHIWTKLPEEETVFSPEASTFADGLLVLVEISNSNQILDIREAKDWVLELVQRYLTHGVTPSHLQQEIERAEQWRQSLTLESQELARRQIELEARREQIQVLEEELKSEKKQLETRMAELRSSNQD